MKNFLGLLMITQMIFEGGEFEFCMFLTCSVLGLYVMEVCCLNEEVLRCFHEFIFSVLDIYLSYF